jgi:type II secretory pathway component PulL
VTWAFRDWLTWAEAFGLGELRLLPDQFWHLTMHEFTVMRDGFFRREDRAWEIAGTLGLWLLAPHTKKHYTVLELLGRKRLVTLPARRLTSEQEAAQLEAEKAAVLARAIAWARGD